MIIGQHILAVVASLAGLVTSTVSHAAAPGDAAVPVYRCQLHTRLPEGGYADLRIDKSFREDGSVNSMHVRWEDNQGSLVRPFQPGDRAFVSLEWPGAHRISSQRELFDWSLGSISIGFLVADPRANSRLLPGEEWRQVIVDRNQSVMVHEHDGMRVLLLSGLDLHLISDLEPPSSRAGFHMSLDSFLAWGAGAGRLTVYQTWVTRREPVANSYPTSPVGRRRVVGAYDVDVAELARAVVLIRDTAQRWEEGLSNRWRQCEPTTEGGEVIVSDPRISPPR